MQDQAPHPQVPSVGQKGCEALGGRKGLCGGFRELQGATNARSSKWQIPAGDVGGQDHHGAQG